MTAVPRDAGYAIASEVLEPSVGALAAHQVGSADPPGPAPTFDIR